MIPSFNDFVSLCRESTKHLPDLFQKASTTAFRKDDGTLVTSLDFDIESYIRSSIRSAYPKHSIQGEELGTHLEDSCYTWIIDPIDGTFSFCSGSPLFGTLIGLSENGIPRYGFMRLPLLGDIILYGDNENSIANAEPLKVKEFNGWSEALVLTTDIETICGSPVTTHWRQAIKLGATARTWGDCYGYYMVCSGRADMMADTGLKSMDILPVLPILKGAGAVIQTYGLNDYSNVMACSPSFMAELKSADKD